MEYIRSVNISGVPVKGAREALYRHYLLFCDRCGATNTVKTYRTYRKACRGVYGIDLSKQRPRKKADPVGVQTALFQGAGHAARKEA